MTQKDFNYHCDCNPGFNEPNCYPNNKCIGGNVNNKGELRNNDYLINNEEELFANLKDYIKKNIANSFDLSIRSNHVLDKNKRDLQLIEIINILDNIGLKYKVSSNIKTHRLKKHDILTHNFTFNFENINNELLNFIEIESNWLRNYDHLLKVYDINLDNYILSIDSEKQKQQIENIKIKVKETLKCKDVSDIIFFENEYVSDGKLSVPEWHIDNEYFETNISEFDYGITLTNPPNINCGTLYIIIPILKITHNFLDSSLLVKKQNLIIEKISQLEGINLISFKIGNISVYHNFNLLKLMRGHFDKLTQDFLNSNYAKINPKLIKMAPTNVLHNVANIFYHRSPSLNKINYTNKFSRGHIVFSN